MERREIITSHFPGTPPRVQAIQFMYDKYVGRYVESLENAPPEAVEAYRIVMEGDMAIRFALHVLDNPEEFEEALKEAEESDREWAEHQAKQPPKAGPA
jgi:hypothetical protein